MATISPTGANISQSEFTSVAVVLVVLIAIAVAIIYYLPTLIATSATNAVGALGGGLWSDFTGGVSAVWGSISDEFSSAVDNLSN